MEPGEIPQAIPYDGVGQRLVIPDGQVLQLTTIACNVYLTTQQAEDPELAAALQMLCRAATLIGRLEDAIVFNGQLPAAPQPPVWPQPVVYAVEGAAPQLGLADPQRGQVQVDMGADVNAFANNLIARVVEAIAQLEGDGQYGPFACVLGQDLYMAANLPQAGFILPSDRIVPFLGSGPLLRSSAMPPGSGVVIALAASPIDLVVGSDVHVSYLQRSVEPRYVLRVSERFVLRVKQPQAVRVLAAVRTGSARTGSLKSSS
jgi:hypothetical protein